MAGSFEGRCWTYSRFEGRFWSLCSFIMTSCLSGLQEQTCYILRGCPGFKHSLKISQNPLLFNVLTQPDENELRVDSTLCNLARRRLMLEVKKLVIKDKDTGCDIDFFFLIFITDSICVLRLMSWLFQSLPRGLLGAQITLRTHSANIDFAFQSSRAASTLPFTPP